MEVLGPGGAHLAYRRRVREELIGKGYERIVLMESTDEVFTDVTLDNKFRRIIADFNPVLIFAFFLAGARMDGVTFELGWLCGNYSALELRSKLKILEQKNYDFSATTPYVEDLFGRVNRIILDESHARSKASTRIHKCAIEFALGDFSLDTVKTDTP